MSFFPAGRRLRNVERVPSVVMLTTMYLTHLVSHQKYKLAKRRINAEDKLRAKDIYCVVQV